MTAAEDVAPVAEKKANKSLTSSYKTHHRGFETLDREHNYWVDDIEGALPADLSGTFFRNGPGRIKVGEDHFGHWFDGDGMISAISFQGGRAHYKNRYVRTPKYIRETRKGRIDFRGFGTQRKGGALANMFRAPANPANTSVVFHGGKLLALYEGGRPYQLDPSNLETLGEYFYEGRLGIQNTFSAHGKINPRTGYYYNFGIGVTGVRRDGLRSCVHLYKISPNGRLVNTVRFPVEGNLPFLHDFGMTENYAVIVVSSIVMDGLLKVAFGTKSVADITSFNRQQQAQVLIVDLNTMQEVERFDLDPMGVIHYGNAWEEKGDIHFELIRFSDFEVFNELKNIVKAPKVGGAEFVHYTVNRKRGTLSCEPIDMVASEFPAWNMEKTGEKNRYTYSVATLDNGTGTYFNSVQKRDAKSGNVTFHDFGPSRFTAEALYIPKTGAKTEDDGYMASVVYDANKHLSEIVLLDAKEIENCIARVKLKHHVPHGFHGHFTQSLFI